eukprot:jgi/Botrbrau1/17943/Bobra.50_1s0038.1
MSEATRHLVVCVDDNEASEHAVSWVLDNLYRPGDELHLVNVVLVFGVTHFPDPHKVDALTCLHLEDGKEKTRVEDFMNKRFKPVLDARGINYSLDVIRNVLETEGVAPTILRTARRLNAPAIVVGKYHKGLERLLHGSLASQLIRHSEVPVLVMR